MRVVRGSRSGIEHGLGSAALVITLMIAASLLAEQSRGLRAVAQVPPRVSGTVG